MSINTVLILSSNMMPSKYFEPAPSADKDLVTCPKAPEKQQREPRCESTFGSQAQYLTDVQRNRNSGAGLKCRQLITVQWFNNKGGGTEAYVMLKQARVKPRGQSEQVNKFDKKQTTIKNPMSGQTKNRYGKENKALTLECHDVTHIVV